MKDRFCEVRLFGVEVLRKCNEDDPELLELISLQLVNSLRYEEIKSVKELSGLARLIFECAIKSKTFFNSVYWSLHCESNNTENSSVIKNHFKQHFEAFYKFAKEKVPVMAAD